MRQRSRALWLGGTLLLLALLFIGLAPWPPVHWLLFDVIWKHPLQVLVALLVSAGWVYLVLNSPTRRRTLTALGAGSLAILILILYIIWSNALVRAYLARGLEPVALPALPETSEVRFLPLEVAQRYAGNRLQDPRLRVGDLDPLDIEGELIWIAPRVPNGLFNSLARQADGFLLVHPDGAVRSVAQAMRYGEGMAVTDAIRWPLWRGRYLVDLPEVFYAPAGEGFLAIAPYVGYRFRFPVQVPYWAGVFVVHADGAVEDLSPAEAVADERLAGLPLYPEALSRRIADAWGYRGGVFNAWFTHLDQTKVPRLPGPNQMPYLLPTADGPQWFFGLEPYGPSFSIFKVMFVDAHDGTLRLHELPADSALIGPDKALGYVRSAFPNFQWYSDSGDEASGNVLAIEPRPLIRAGRLYWLTSITSIDYAGVTRSVVVDAATNEVRYLESQAELRRFVAGEFAGRAAGQATGAPAPAGTPAAGFDLAGLSDEELLRLIGDAAAELERRR